MGSASLGRDAGELAGIPTLGVPVTEPTPETLSHATVAVDVSAPAACALVAPWCSARNTPYVVGSTGLEAADEQALVEASATVPVLTAANFSVGVNVTLELATLAAQRLGTSADIEISEIHHRRKRDAPSGTAWALASALERGRDDLRPMVGRTGTDLRAPDELGLAALRGGDVSGEHTVYFFLDGERLEITHRATTPDIFARGALRAASWVVSQLPGRYTMADALADPSI